MTHEQPAPTPLARLHEKKRPAVRYAIGLLVLFCMLLIAAQTWSIWSSRQSQLAESTAATSNMTGALAAHAESTIRIVDTVLTSVVDRVEQDGLAPASAGRLQDHVRTMVDKVDELHGLFIYGADGAWLVTSQAAPIAQFTGNHADREYFQYHRNNPDRGAYIGKPVRSRAGGAWILPVSRRLQHADGSFAGVALGMIRINFFAEFYEGFNVGKEGSIFLALDNGTVIYRRPFDEGLIGRSVADGPVFRTFERQAGNATAASGIDGVVRLYSYRRLDRLPLVVATAQSKREILVAWRQSALQTSAATTLVVILLSVVGGRLVRQIMIRDALEDQLLSARDDLQERNQELTVLATRDGLTGISNRRHFDDILQLELNRARRSGTPLSLVLIDVDFFKKFNDHYGHVAGDDCLRQVAAALRDGLARPSDLAARYGGEEFAIVLPATGQIAARYVAERLRLAVMDLAIAHADHPCGIATISAGACTYHGASGETCLPEAFTSRADALLYHAKASGRNRVCSDLDHIAQPATPTLVV
jgi:diguanylate cyclase (GGDEF)-like protein